MNEKPQRKFSVLIADDTAADRFILKSAIGDHAPHFEVVGEVDSGEHLIHYLSGKAEYADRVKHPFPDLLFLDLRMPGKDGFEVLEWLQKNGFPHLKVAVLSDSAGLAYQSEALALGANYFLHKPSVAQELGIAVKKLQDELLAADNAATP